MCETRRSKWADDSVDCSCIKPVSTEQIRAVIKFLPILESISPEDLAHLVKPPEFAEDSLLVGHLEYHPAVYESMQACYDNEFVQRTFDWPAWAKEGSRYLSDPTLVASASLATCIKLIMASVRYERFCDGHMGEVIRSGHIAAILRRLEQLARPLLEDANAG